MNNSHESNAPQPEPDSQIPAGDSPPPSLSAASLAPIAKGGLTAKSLPSKSTVKRSRRKYWIAGVVVLLLAVATTTFLLARPAGPRMDVILFKVKKEPLNVSVTEKGTLESSANTDLVCKVRAGTKGFATTVNWVVDDGTRVNPGDPLMILDDSALKDQQEQEEITVYNAQRDDIKAEQDYEISIKTNEIAVANARSNVLNKEIALEKLLGLEVDSSQIPLAAVAGIISIVRENGSYRLDLDNLNGQITDALSNVEQNQERSAWSQRMVKQAYMSPAQAEADKSRLDSSIETLRSLRAKRTLMMNYDRRQQIAQYTTDRDNARLDLDKAILTSLAQEKQTLISKKTARAVYIKESEKLLDIKQQRSECRINAPKTIRAGSMVVYFKPEGNRFGTQTTALIEQGAQVKEGQKMLRIPNLEMMQVNTKIHEAMVSRIRGDNRVPTRISECIQISLLTNLDLFGRAFSTRQPTLDLISSGDAESPDRFKLTDQAVSEMSKQHIVSKSVLSKLRPLLDREFSRGEFEGEVAKLLGEKEGEYLDSIIAHSHKRTAVHDLEFQITEAGQRAVVRIEAMPDKRYVGHVKLVSQVANQNDVMMSDVKLYPTLVIVDNELGTDGQLLPVSGEILKPDMTAEVTINVDASKEPVLTIPLQAVIGGAEMGTNREVFLKTPTGYERRSVTLGLYNDKIIEVREGLAEGDEVVTNPKVLMGDSKTKTRDESDKSGKGKEGNKEGGDPSKKGKKGGGGPPGGGGPKA